MKTNKSLDWFHMFVVWWRRKCWCCWLWEPPNTTIYRWLTWKWVDDDQINEIVEKIRLWMLIKEMKVWMSNKNFNDISLIDIHFFLTILPFIDQYFIDFSLLEIWVEKHLFYSSDDVSNNRPEQSLSISNNLTNGQSSRFHIHPSIISRQQRHISCSFRIWMFFITGVQKSTSTWNDCYNIILPTNGRPCSDLIVVHFMKICLSFFSTSFEEKILFFSNTIY